MHKLMKPLGWEAKRLHRHIAFDLIVQITMTWTNENIHRLHWQMSPSVRRLEVTILSFTMPLPSHPSQRKRYETLYGTCLLFISTIDPLFSFLLPMVGSRRMFFVLWLNWYCANKWRISFTLSLSLFSLSSRTFVHTCRYNQYRAKVPQMGFKVLENALKENFP